MTMFLVQMGVGEIVGTGRDVNEFSPDLQNKDVDLNAWDCRFRAEAELFSTTGCRYGLHTKEQIALNLI